MGKEIPAGKYSVHENTKGSVVMSFRDWNHYQTGSQWNALESLSLDASTLTGVITLAEGQIFVVEKNSVIMNKYAPSFTFN